jgi:two-component system nitrogen regulation sensor histidine kinase NtrY
MIDGKQGERLFSATIDGETKPIRIHVRYLPQVRLYNFMVFDITVQDHIKQIQLWAKVAQKLAHGIKNPLTSVKLNAEELREYLREKCLLDEEEVSDYIQSITNQVDKLKRMSDGFMRFVEFDKPELKPYNMNELIEELVAQWKPAQTSGIRIDLDLAGDLPAALLDKEQFIYAFQNIFFNAVQSIEGNGRIDISTRLVHSVAELGAHKTAFLELRVQDTGVGIPPEYLDKITQPYFTTKKDGTGLGLSIVEKIVDSHDGMFDIQSRMHEGTTVTMRWRAKT